MIGCITYHWISIYTSKWCKVQDTAAIAPIGPVIAHAVLGLVYTVVRVYLLVEPLIALRALPEGAFINVQWASYWPHI